MLPTETVCHMGSFKTVRDFLLPDKTAVHDNCLPAQPVHVTVLHRKHDRSTIAWTVSAECLFLVDGSLERKREIPENLGRKEILAG